MSRTDPLREAAEIAPSSVADDLLRGAGEIVVEIYGEDTPANRRRFYHEQGRWPCFKLDPTGVLYALKSRLRAHCSLKSAEAEGRITAAANAKATAAVVKAPRRRRAQRRARSNQAKISFDA
jgi:hypothetical protein